MHTISTFIRIFIRSVGTLFKAVTPQIFMNTRHAVTAKLCEISVNVLLAEHATQLAHQVRLVLAHWVLQPIASPRRSTGPFAGVVPFASVRPPIVIVVPAVNFTKTLLTPFCRKVLFAAFYLEFRLVLFAKVHCFAHKMLVKLTPVLPECRVCAEFLVLKVI